MTFNGIIYLFLYINRSVFSGIVLFFIKRYFDNKEKIEIEKEKARQKENVLILKSIDAIGRLTYADSIAIRDGKINGEMTANRQNERCCSILYSY